MADPTPPPPAADRRLLPPGIRDERSEILLELIERLGGLDLARLLVYRIDEVHVDVLPLLAWQFDVAGLKGWALATTEAARRALVARAVELHRYRGTPWAVKEALRSVGHPNPEIQERAAVLRRDGTILRDGSKRRQPARSWAIFRVRLGPLDEATGITRADRDAIAGLVNVYRNARSHLRSIIYVLDAVGEGGPAPGDHEVTAAARRFYRRNGRYLRDGTIRRRPFLDTPVVLE